MHLLCSLLQNSVITPNYKFSAIWLLDIFGDHLAQQAPGDFFSPPYFTETDEVKAELANFPLLEPIWPLSAEIKLN